MHILMICSILALAAAQNTVDQSVLDNIFGTPPTPAKKPVETTQRLEDRPPPRGSRLVDVGAQATTIEPSVLMEVFGTPLTTKPTGFESRPPPRGSRLAYVRAQATTIEPSVLMEVFGTPLTTKPTGFESRPRPHESSLVDVGGQATTIEPSVLKKVFGTPLTTKPTASENRPRPHGSSLNDVGGLATTIEPSVLKKVFGTPLTTKPTGSENITVKPTEGTSTFINKEGQSCQCVPYYLCDDKHVGVNINNASITGWGLLDIRFGDDQTDRKCQESVEICCTAPQDPKVVPKPKPQPARGCGYRNPQGLGATITGGTGAEAQFGEFPWVVALLADDRSYPGVGVLIHPQVVMTGAHIASKYRPSQLKIRAGEWDTQTAKEIFAHEERTVQNMIIHENFQPKSLKNDIALLRLDSPIPITEHINVICMPEQDEVFDSSKNCVANGWGKNEFGKEGSYAVILKKVEVDIVPFSRCNSLLKRTRLGNNFKLHNSFVCAGGEEGKDTCQGDGGAPLACPIGNDRYKLTGLVAWGIGCGQKDVPAVYANVPLFRQWVDDKMAEWEFQATSYRYSPIE